VERERKGIACAFGGVLSELEGENRTSGSKLVQNWLPANKTNRRGIKKKGVQTKGV